MWCVCGTPLYGSDMRERLCLDCIRALPKDPTPLPQQEVTIDSGDDPPRVIPVEEILQEDKGMP
jgi:hypothetical protein